MTSPPSPEPRDSIAATVGRLLCVGIPGTHLEAATRRTIEALHPGTIILFRRNIGTVDELTDLCGALHDLPSRPLVAIDHEGGRVMRVAAPFTHFPPAAAIGRTGRIETAYEVGCAMAAELRSVGIDLSFAPVLDVDSNPANPVIGDRSFSADPQQVSAMGLAQMRGLLDGGVLACGKHFPGHGDTAQDSHHELPFVRRSRTEIENLELLPFRDAIAARIPMIMTAHVVYTALDPLYPATLSRRIVSDLLRVELGFTGVVASDDLDMRAIADLQPIGQTVIGAVQAGVDMLLLCNSLDQATQAHATLLTAIEGGVVDMESVQAAAARILHLRTMLAPARVRCTLPSRLHQALADSI